MKELNYVECVALINLYEFAFAQCRVEPNNYKWAALLFKVMAVMDKRL